MSSMMFDFELNILKSLVSDTSLLPTWRYKWEDENWLAENLALTKSGETWDTYEGSTNYKELSSLSGNLLYINVGLAPMDNEDQITEILEYEINFLVSPRP